VHGTGGGHVCESRCGRLHEAVGRSSSGTFVESGVSGREEMSACRRSKYSLAKYLDARDWWQSYSITLRYGGEVGPIALKMRLRLAK